MDDADVEAAAYYWSLDTIVTSLVDDELE